ncbi:DUT nucleotidohydrolase, partial [Polyodon spathula]|nr:DUT nucleotidohydrolase [Polyodon spathula]
PHEVVKINTGLGLECPKGTYGHVLPRSGLALKGVIVMAGIIDRNYQGPLQVVLQNTSEVPIVLNKGDKIAQLLIKPCNMNDVTEVNKPLTNTARGIGGFGSTDIN